MIDSYAHIGYPHFGKPEELVAVWEQWGIDKGCIALPPGLPDLEGLAKAQELLGENVRLFGIPFGPDPAKRLELGRIQVDRGIAGMRLAPGEILANPELLDLLGSRGLCLMAINVYSDPAVTRFVLRWLEKFDQGSIASPHFLATRGIDEAAGDPILFRELLSHPRMNAIFSRHGGISKKSYPHDDLKPWVEEVASLLTWNRILWGSEFPVLYHRDEQFDEALDWLGRLGIPMKESEEAAYLQGNGQRLFFDSPPPEVESILELPDWVQEANRNFVAQERPVPVVRTKELLLPLHLHGRLLSDYLEVQQSNPDLRFQDYLVRLLQKYVGE